MPTTLRSPRNSIHTRHMPLQLSNRDCWRPIHQNCSHIPQILFVPSQSQQGCIRSRTLIYNSRMFFIS
ncbi:hypothetical protein OIU84_002149 [Salix udensis]|uniref:Uncharacterized protein n=1 Tax=Salix udensis TaxID=889485 RepID=A0AAD6P6U9_9ROSI|nr:hypothetical protein OIU84_002149 [Salix udensis]